MAAKRADSHGNTVSSNALAHLEPLACPTHSKPFPLRHAMKPLSIADAPGARFPACFSSVCNCNPHRRVSGKMIGIKRRLHDARLRHRMQANGAGGLFRGFNHRARSAKSVVQHIAYYKGEEASRMIPSNLFFPRPSYFKYQFDVTRRMKNGY